MGNERRAFKCQRNSDEASAYARLDKLKMSRKNIARFTQHLNKDDYQFEILKGRKTGQILFSIDVTRASRNKKELKKLIHTLKRNLNKNQDKDVEKNILKSESSELAKELLVCYNKSSQDSDEVDEDERSDSRDTSEDTDDENENSDDNDKSDDTDEDFSSGSNEKAHVRKSNAKTLGPVEKVDTHRELNKAEQKLSEKEKKEIAKQEKCYAKVQRTIEKNRKKEEANRIRAKIQKMKCESKFRTSSHRPHNVVDPYTEEPSYQELKKRYDKLKHKLEILENDKKSRKHDKFEYPDSLSNDEVSKEKSPKHNKSKGKEKGKLDRTEESREKSLSEKNSKLIFSDDAESDGSNLLKSNEKIPRKTSNKPKKKDSVDKKHKSEGKVKASNKKDSKDTEPKKRSKSKVPKEKTPKKVKIKAKKEKPKHRKSKEKKQPKKKGKKEKALKVNYAMIQETHLSNGEMLRKPIERRTKEYVQTSYYETVKLNNKVETAKERVPKISNLCPTDLKVETHHDDTVTNLSKTIPGRKMVTKSENYDYVPQKKYSSEQVICSESLKTLSSIDV